MRCLRLARALALALLVRGSASASDLPLTYTVEEIPLKAVPAGTALTFELFSDRTCTASMGAVNVPIESVTLLSRLKLLTPRGAPKQPRTVEMRHMVLVGSVPSPLYLRVGGPGVVPVGGSCQAQPAATAGGGSCSPEEATGTCNANTFAVLDLTCSGGRKATGASAIWHTPFDAADNGPFYILPRSNDTWTVVAYNHGAGQQQFRFFIQCCS